MNKFVMFLVGLLVHQSSVADLEVGFGVADITPSGFESWVDSNSNGKYEPDKGDRFNDENGNGKFDALWLAGFGQPRPASGVHDPLEARTVVIEKDGKRVAWVAIDAIGFFRNHVLEIKKALPKVWAIDDLIVCSTHDHAAPDLMGNWGKTMFQSGVKKGYLKKVQRAVRASVETALNSLEPAKVRAVEIPLDPKKHMRDSRKPEVFDANIRVLQFVTADESETLGSVLNWGNHVETAWSQNTLVTSDFAGFFRKGVEKGLMDEDGNIAVEGIGGVHLFIPGLVGGLMTTSPSVKIEDPLTQVEYKEPSFDKVKAQGRLLAYKTLKGLSASEWKFNENPRFSFKKKVFRLKIQNNLFILAGVLGVLKRKFLFRGNFQVETEVNYIRIGDAAILTIPGELYPEIAFGGIEHPEGADFDIEPVEVPELQAYMPGRVNFYWGLANDELGYLIPKSEWDEKPPYLYGAKKSPYGEVNSLGPDAGPGVYRALVEALETAPE